MKEPDSDIVYGKWEGCICFCILPKPILEAMIVGDESAEALKGPNVPVWESTWNKTEEKYFSSEGITTIPRYNKVTTTYMTSITFYDICRRGLRSLKC